jgi:hypothetical protein
LPGARAPKERNGLRAAAGLGMKEGWLELPAPCHEEGEMSTHSLKTRLRTVERAESELSRLRDGPRVRAALLQFLSCCIPKPQHSSRRDTKERRLCTKT